MKKLVKLAVVASLVAPLAAMAQASNFEGFYGQIGAGYENNSVGSSDFSLTFSGQAGTPKINTPAVNGGTGQINLEVGYNFPLNATYLLGVGIEYSTMKSKDLTTGQVTGCNGSCDATMKYEVSNRYSVFLTPSYIIDKDSLAYLKVGYSNQKLQQTLVETANLDANNNASFGSSSLSGYVLGFGYKQMVSNGFYGFGEANYYSYSSASFNPALTGYSITGNSPKPSAYIVSVGIGYKF
jgi:opacity protein-like surface antigen